jgi:predicted NUDIX family NTP pyrophosphohydrolase
MSLQSAGILLFRFTNGKLEVLLAHPGGPFWTNRDDGAWSIPKGLIDEHETALDAAKREFKEETGFDVQGECIQLGALKQPSGKTVHAWAVEQDIDATQIVSNTFELEWPKDSGNVHAYPEIDKGAWFDLARARIKISKGQAGFLDRLVKQLGSISKNHETDT